MLREPRPPEPKWPRYSKLAFPAYRYVPGLNPHPRTHPEGHSHGRVEPEPPSWDPDGWRLLTPYLHGIDLYNFAYWWECHETLEGLWISAGRRTPHARFVQGLIQIAAANLQRHRSHRHASLSLAEKGIRGLESGASGAQTYMGIRVPSFVADARAHFWGHREAPALIRLEI